MLGIIKRAFSHLDKYSFVKLYKTIVRPCLEYGNSIWSPQLKRQMKEIEKVQRRAIKTLKGFREISYEERLKLLKLPSLKYRRFRGDMIQAFKILKGIDDVNVKDFYDLNTNNTRKNDIKLTIKFCHTRLTPKSFVLVIAQPNIGTHCHQKPEEQMI